MGNQFPMSIKINIGTQETKKLVETMDIRSKLNSTTDMPLTENRCRISVVSEHLRERCLGTRQPRSANRKIGPFHPYPLLVAPRQKRDSRRRADGSSTIVVCQANSLTRQMIELRCTNVADAITSQISISQIVGQDVDDMGLVRLGICVSNKKNKNKERKHSCRHDQ